ncbi:hypothetical protein CGRA01v4_03708 [Colletotrichum graminicola]|nr:hypothetical protein CGRA01v4_03708 [Colletotrichum graminicola]
MYLCLQAWPAIRDIEAGNETQASYGLVWSGLCRTGSTDGRGAVTSLSPPLMPRPRSRLPSSSISTSPRYQVPVPLLSRVSPRPVSHRKFREKSDSGWQCKIDPCRARSYERENMVRSHQHQLYKLAASMCGCYDSAFPS